MGVVKICDTQVLHSQLPKNTGNKYIFTFDLWCLLTNTPYGDVDHDRENDHDGAEDEETDRSQWYKHL